MFKKCSNGVDFSVPTFGEIGSSQRGGDKKDRWANHAV